LKQLYKKDAAPRGCDAFSLVASSAEINDYVFLCLLSHLEFVHTADEVAEGADQHLRFLYDVDVYKHSLWRAMSIIPLLSAAPAKTPMAAMAMMVLNDAALEPIAELMKLTAPLLTPTTRSKMASTMRKTTIPIKIVSILLFDLFVVYVDC
jgi:hypothetical protein